MNSLIEEYKKLDISFTLTKKYEFQDLVNFSKTKDLPIHRWYYYVEGYSPLLIDKIIKYIGIEKNINTVIDPFSGSGTTLVYSKEKHYKSYGFETNPFSRFMARAKCQNYTKDDIATFRAFKTPEIDITQNPYELYELRIIQNLFDMSVLQEIEAIKLAIKAEKEERVRDLLLATLLSILPTVSNYRKGGNGLKKKVRRNEKDTFSLFKEKQNIILDDICDDQNSIEPIIISDSCLNLENYGLPNFDLAFFSPPYVNCFDPFEVYKTELWIGNFVNSYSELRELRRSGLTSNLYSNLTQQYDFPTRSTLLTAIISKINTEILWDKRIPKMLDTYFFEMHKVLQSIYKSLNKNGHCIIVVGNSAYGNIAVPTDLLLCQIAQNIGYTPLEVIEARKNETSSQQHNKLGNYLEYIRESIVILKK